MTEYNAFITLNMKNMCRACLRVTQELLPMTSMEINAFQNFAGKVSNMDSYINLCKICSWLLKKCMKFTQQCQKANEFMNESVKMDTKPDLFIQKISIYDFKICSQEPEYIGPKSDEDSNGEVDELNGFGDEMDDDDEIPLVMLRDDYKRRRSDSYENPEIQIKQEPDIKEEYVEDVPKLRSKKNKREVREGFSSRMVQETNEYIVIKLSKEQVLSELTEKAKTDSYIRSPYKCEKCVKGFNFEDVLSTHMSKHSLENGTYQCDICTQYCPSPVSLRGHMKSHTTRYKCKLCGQVRLSRQHLLEHHAITHTAAPTTYTCDKCQFTTNKRTVIQRHVKTHATNERHACHRCGKLFTTIESLRVHTTRHDKSKRLECVHCEKQFIYPSLLHKHIQAVHERIDYYCVECDVRFKSPESLRLHFKKAKRHRDSSSYKYSCPSCPQRFVSASSLRVHQCSAHEAAREHACALCVRVYSTRDALRAHAWRVHAHRDPSVCSVCGGSFARKSVLKVHMRTHTGDRPHVCECGAAFTQKSTLKTHAAKHQKHNNLTNGVQDTPSIPQEESVQ